jgi:hypothetical protein
MAFEEKTEDQASATKRRRKDRDCVQVNVGGTIFTTSKLTLISNSSYFASRFSPDWNDREDTYTNGTSIFVDQNPKSFEVLLAFMREGFIKKSELTESVLSQAEYFGIENLLRAVKCAAFRYINPVTCTISDDEACKRFDNTYGGIVGAIKEGVLPLKIKKISQEPHGAKEQSINLRTSRHILQEIAKEVPNLPKASNFELQISKIQQVGNGRYTFEGETPNSGVKTPEGKLFCGSYSPKIWRSDEIKPYHEQIKEIWGQHGRGRGKPRDKESAGRKLQELKQ